MIYLKWTILALVLLGCTINTGLSKPIDEEDDYDSEYIQDHDNKDDELDYGPEMPIERNDIQDNQTPYVEVPDTVQTITAQEGENFQLSCLAKGLTPPNMILWYNGTKLIYQIKRSLSSRVEHVDQQTIRIMDAKPTDSNMYYCQILPRHEFSNITVTVLSLPKVNIFSHGRNVTSLAITFRQKDRVEFECVAVGIGAHNILWSFKGKRLKDNNVSGGKIVFEHVRPHDAGLYQCLGDDQSENPPHGSVMLHVQYKPKVVTHRHFVNTQHGDTAELVCEYQADPIAVAHWKKRGEYIPQSSNKYVILSGSDGNKNKTELQIKTVEDHDLGDYECEIRNSIGFDKANIHVIYTPEIPQFEKMDIQDNQVILYWLVRSKQSLIEAVLNYKINETETWMTKNPIHTELDNDKHSIWRIRHELELSPGVWHAQLKAKNSAGWSRFSHEHTFRVNEPQEDNSKSEDIIYTSSIGFGSSTGGGSERLLPSSITVITLLVSVVLAKLSKRL